MSNGILACTEAIEYAVSSAAHELTHHVGLGTFRPVEVEDLRRHKMDSEQYFLPHETVL